MEPTRFAPAAPTESIVHGACRPGYLSGEFSTGVVDSWIEQMQGHDIARVCCLLADTVESYEDLFGRYEAVFGPDRVCAAPISDYSAVSERTLTETILPFLRDADAAGERVVVHCSAGMGRTGHVLALWLACERDYALAEAIDAVEETGRSPLEATSQDQLRALVDACR